MAWFYLVLAGMFEIAWAVGLKYTEGFSRFWPSCATIGAMLLSIILLSSAMKHIPLGTAYAVWTGIGAVGTVILGMLLFGDAATVGRIMCLCLILAGIIGLKVLS